MILLIAAVGFFGGLHLVPAFPNLKAKIKNALRRSYGPVYGFASIVGLCLVIAAFRGAERVDIYEPPSWGRHANFLLTLIAFCLIGIFLSRGSWRNVLRYPMGLAVGFWGAGHLLANGDSASLVLFGGLIIAAAFQAYFSMRNVTYAPTEERNGHNLFSLLVGLALYALFAQLHGVVIGVPVFSIGS